MWAGIALLLCPGLEETRQTLAPRGSSGRRQSGQWHAASVLVIFVDEFSLGRRIFPIAHEFAQPWTRRFPPHERGKRHGRGAAAGARRPCGPGLPAVPRQDRRLAFARRRRGGRVRRGRLEAHDSDGR